MTRVVEALHIAAKAYQAQLPTRSRWHYWYPMGALVGLAVLPMLLAILWCPSRWVVLLMVSGQAGFASAGLLVCLLCGANQLQLPVGYGEGIALVLLSLVVQVPPALIVWMVPTAVTDAFLSKELLLCLVYGGLATLFVSEACEWVTLDTRGKCRDRKCEKSV